jgi:hypothetical protein
MAKQSINVRQLSGNLNFSTVQKMIGRLLTNDRIKTNLDEGKIKKLEAHNKPEIRLKAFTKKELAEKIGISLKELNKLKSPNFYNEMADRISLPLIKLYCATKFI